MSITNPYDHSTRTSSQRRPGRSRLAIRKEVFVHGLLSIMFYIALWRGTGMWYGLPANFDEGTDLSVLPQQLILYSLIPLFALYIICEPSRVLSCLRSTSTSIVALIVTCAASVLMSVAFGASLRGMIAVGLLTAPPIIFRFRYGASEAYRALSNFICVAAFANIIYTIAFPQFAIMAGNGYDGMVKGLFYHKNVLGQFAAVGALTLIFASSSRQRSRLFSLFRWPAILCLMVLTVVSQSSTAVVMLFIGCAMVYGLGIMLRFGNSLLQALTALMSCILVGALGSLAYLGVAQAIASAFGKDLTLSGRSDIWDEVLPLISDRPILGFGFSTFRQTAIVEQYISLNHTVHSLHNTFLELLLTIGIPGTILWIFILLARVSHKISSVHADSERRLVQAKDATIILMTMIGAFTEAGVMLSPSFTWVVMCMVLPLNISPPVGVSSYSAKRMLVTEKRRNVV